MGALALSHWRFAREASPDKRRGADAEARLPEEVPARGRLQQSRLDRSSARFIRYSLVIASSIFSRTLATMVRAAICGASDAPQLLWRACDQPLPGLFDKQ